MLINERTTIRLPWPDLFPLFPSTTAQLIYPSTFTFHFLTYPLLTPSPAFLLHVSPYYLHFPFSPPSTSLLLPKTSAASPRHSPSPSPSLSPQSPSPRRRRPVWCLSGLISGWWIVLIGSRYQLNSSGTTSNHLAGGRHQKKRDIQR